MKACLVSESQGLIIFQKYQKIKVSSYQLNYYSFQIVNRKRKNLKPNIFLGIITVDWNGWTKIDKVEVERGIKCGKPREKIVDVDEMLQIGGILK